MANTHENMEFGISEVKKLADTRVFGAVIITIDRENNQADIETDKWGRIDDVPFHFHCGGEETVDRGNEAFFEDDPVYVMYEGGRGFPNETPDASNLKIVAHREMLYPCYGYLVIQVGECFTVWDVKNNEVVDEITININGEERVINPPCPRSEITPWLETMVRSNTSIVDAPLFVNQFSVSPTDMFRYDCNTPFVWTWSPSGYVSAWEPPCEEITCSFIDHPDFSCDYEWTTTSSGSPRNYCNDKDHGFASASVIDFYDQAEGTTYMATLWGGAWNLDYRRPGGSIGWRGCIAQKRDYERIFSQGVGGTLTLDHQIQTPIGNIDLPWSDSMTVLGATSMGHVYSGYLASNCRMNYFDGLRSTELSNFEDDESCNFLTAYEFFHATEDISNLKYDKLMGVTHFKPMKRHGASLLTDDHGEHSWFNAVQIYLVDTFYISGEMDVLVPLSEPSQYPTVNYCNHEVKVIAACENISSAQAESFRPIDQTRNTALENAIKSLYDYARIYHGVASDMLGPDELHMPSDQFTCEWVFGYVWEGIPLDDLSQYGDKTSCEEAGYRWDQYGQACKLPNNQEDCEAVGAIWENGMCEWESG